MPGDIQLVEKLSCFIKLTHFRMRPHEVCANLNGVHLRAEHRFDQFLDFAEIPEPARLALISART